VSYELQGPGRHELAPFQSAYYSAEKREQDFRLFGSVREGKEEMVQVKACWTLVYEALSF
jgi:hypothetical protein